MKLCLPNTVRRFLCRRFSPFACGPVSAPVPPVPTNPYPYIAQPPAIVSPLALTGFVGVPLVYQIVATNQPADFGATGLPGGLSVNTVTGVISGTPTASGATNSGISASNYVGTGNATLAFSIAASYPATVTFSGTYTAPNLGSSPAPPSLAFSATLALSGNSYHITSIALGTVFYPSGPNAGHLPASLLGISLGPSGTNYRLQLGTLIIVANGPDFQSALGLSLYGSYSSIQGFVPGFGGNPNYGYSLTGLTVGI